MVSSCSSDILWDTELNVAQNPRFRGKCTTIHALTRYIQSIHIRIVGQSFYKIITTRKGNNGTEELARLSTAQLTLLIAQYIDSPLITFAICLDSLVCIKDLTLRFSECKGGEVSLQSIYLLAPWFLSCLFLTLLTLSSNRFDYHQSTVIGAKSISRLRQCCEAIWGESLSRSHLSYHSKALLKFKILVSVLSIPCTFPPPRNFFLYLSLSFQLD